MLSHPLPRLLGLACGLAIAAVATAAVTVRADIERLTRNAELVVDADVLATSTSFDAATGSVWTVHDLRVRETLRGDAEATRLRVHVPGGTAGGISQDVSGTARLAEGERRVTFLWRDGERLQVVGQAQGTFLVTRGAEGELACTNDVAGLVLVDPTGKAVDAGAITVSLADLGRRVRRVDDDEKAERERRKRALAARLARLREQAVRNAESTRGKPGGAR